MSNLGWLHQSSRQVEFDLQCRLLLLDRKMDRLQLASQYPDQPRYLSGLWPELLSQANSTNHLQVEAHHHSDRHDPVKSHLYWRSHNYRKAHKLSSMHNEPKNNWTNNMRGKDEKRRI